MPNDRISKGERDELVVRIVHWDREAYPEQNGGAPPTERARKRAEEAYYATLAEYGDRLPRRVFGRCPFTGKPLLRAIDPYGLDGPWWHKNSVLRLQEPKPPRSYQIHLGALTLRGREPAEATEEVIPGPDAPFVVPRLLRLPGMIAVLTQLDLECGDRAWVISYWSQEDIPPVRLHQRWLRMDHWFTNARGNASWTIANDIWDFDLEPYLADGRLRWIEPDDAQHLVRTQGEGRRCPFVGLPSDHRPQVITRYGCDLRDLPNGEMINPFED